MKYAVFTDGILPGLNSLETEPLSFLKCSQKVYNQFIEHADGEDIVYSEQLKVLVVLGRLVKVDNSLGDNMVELWTEHKVESKPQVGSAMSHTIIMTKPLKDYTLTMPKALRNSLPGFRQMVGY